MRTSERGLAEIASHEGIVLSPYKDSAGVWTIGIGHTAGAGPPNPETDRRRLSVDGAMSIFTRDVTRFENRVRQAFKRPLSQEQFDAAVSFDFNTGAIHRAFWVDLFNEGNLSGAREAFMAWRKPAEIIPRREKERDLFFNGIYAGDGRANVYLASANGRVKWGGGTRVVLPNFLGSTPQQSETTMPSLKGFRTVIANVLVALASIAAIYGVEIPPEQIDEITVGIIAAFTVINTVMRAITNTRMGEKE